MSIKEKFDNALKKAFIAQNATKIIDVVLALASAKSLEGKRTFILVGILIGITWGKAHGWLDPYMDDKLYHTVFNTLASAALVTGAVHKGKKKD